MGTGSCAFNADNNGRYAYLVVARTEAENRSRLAFLKLFDAVNQLEKSIEAGHQFDISKHTKSFQIRAAGEVVAYVYSGEHPRAVFSAFGKDRYGQQGEQQATVFATSR